MREAIRLATNAGQGREVALLHNNLGFDLWGFQGPQAALAELRTGIAYATARGLTEVADCTTASTLVPCSTRASSTRHSPSQARSASAATTTSSPSARFAASRRASTPSAASQHSPPTTWTGWKPPAATPEPQKPSSSAWDPPPSPTPRSETRHTPPRFSVNSQQPQARATTPYYAALLASARQNRHHHRPPDVAQSLTSDYQPHTPYAHHALIAATAALAEARGDHQAAADGYADAADRWEHFGVIPEHAYALQGHGRCLINLGRPHEAAPILQHARELFAQLARAPALAETDTLLQRAVALSS